MDPVSIFFIASTIISVLGSVADTIVDKIKDGKNHSIEEVYNTINKAMTMARTRGEDALAKLQSKLSSMDVIKKSPLLSEVVNKYRKKLENRANQLRDDLAELDIVGTEAQMKYDRAHNDDIFTKNQSDQEFKEMEEKVNDIAKKVEQRL